MTPELSHAHANLLTRYVCEADADLPLLLINPLTKSIWPAGLPTDRSQRFSPCTARVSTCHLTTPPPKDKAVTWAAQAFVCNDIRSRRKDSPDRNRSPANPPPQSSRPLEQHLEGTASRIGSWRVTVGCFAGGSAIRRRSRKLFRHGRAPGQSRRPS